VELKEKIARIESIRNEVNDLHPILENILPRLPGVVSHEYTHGQYERGADFVVEIENAATRRRSHTGVVVKAGKVSGGKVPEIEEQVKECVESRTYRVMSKVRCVSTWVFCSGGFSERAKEKLQERLAGRSVEFFDATDIARFVDEHFAFFWDDLPIEIGNYFQSSQLRLGALDQSSLIVGAAGSADLYIELDVFEKVSKTYSQNRHQSPTTRNVDFFKESATTKLGLLEAEMGFGKSRLVRRLATKLCNAESFRRTRLLPIFSSFRGFIEKHQGQLSLLVESELGPANKHIGVDGIEALVILDGLDECSDPTRTSAQHFEKLREQLQRNQNYRAIVTTRPLRSIVDKASLYHEARTFGIRPLSLAKMVRYLEDTCRKTNLPVRLFEDLKKSSLFKQLPHSPIAAALFSNLLTKNQQEVPQSLTELYAKSLELMLGRWDVRKELTSEKQFKTAQLISEHIACHFLEHKLAYISKSEMIEMIVDYLKRRNTGVSPEQVASLLLDRSTVFSVDDDAQVISFRHRSFAEYLCAVRRSRDRSLAVGDAALNPYWVNVFFFYVGTLADCPEVLIELRKAVAKDENEEWMRLISVPGYLLAAYQTEYDEVERNVKVSLLETARLYHRVKEGNTKTRLKELPEMHLLYLFRSVVAESYGYDYFDSGITSAMLQISSELEDEAVKDHAMFFLACAAAHAGSTEGFKFILEERGVEKLPVAISLGIRCELESSTNIEKSSLLKSHRSKLEKLLFGSGKQRTKHELLGVQQQLTDLFEKPLSTRRVIDGVTR
jgi:NACHT domain